MAKHLLSQKVTISIPRQLDKLVIALSKDLNMTKSAFIRYAIENYLDVYTHPHLDDEIMDRI